ncbi:MAG TPA: hypothetical protein VFE13_03115 [Caulobacteraceae bacterium]|jgi:hypothetical protein|nr:hypothetical protein [Caulobacteraceae bacterium]
MTAPDRHAPSFARRTFLAAAIAAFGLVGGAHAYADPEPVDLQVVDRATGQPIQVWRHGGRLFVAGQPGARYSLRVANHTPGRVLVVLSVDGVNILTGETASYDQRGYVFDPYETYDVSGWRKTQSEIAAFAFAPLSRSYAARTGRPTDVGVIGMAVFREKVVPPPEPEPYAQDELDRGAADSPSLARGAPPPPAAAPQPADRSASRGYAAGALAGRRDERLGTAHGAREWSYVATTTFERATLYPWTVRQIEYDTYAHLLAAGVIPRPWRAPDRPRPFPMDPEGAGYVPDPPG